MKGSMMLTKENIQELIPEEEQLKELETDFKSATVRTCVQDLQTLIPNDELAEQANGEDCEEESEIPEEFFKATDGMAFIENVLDDRLIASVYVDEKGQRTFEVCQRYCDGTISGKMRIRQADLYRLAMANFKVESIQSSQERQRTRKFLSQFADEYLGKMEKDEIIYPMEILQAVFAVREKLPVHREEPELPAQHLYRQVMEIFEDQMSGHSDLKMFKRKAYYVLFRDTMEDLARYMNIPMIKLVHKLAEYNLLYVQSSGNGYQSKIRIDDETTEWAYCLYDLKYLSQAKKNSENRK